MKINEDGYLAEERTGLFPQVYLDRIRHKFVCFVKYKGISVETTGQTWQEAKEKWNMRE